MFLVLTCAKQGEGKEKENQSESLSWLTEILLFNL